ncbi:DEAD/DEAH box helicase [Aureibacillus halotolerans]|uniref:Competence protein ComFA n=1 Tax=Aureibacillus halotolerans TaxID=1508390 RepID=A0A4R6U1H6_9BACI|nr:DEAD/DEAH box helicase family protein [Aureibacillus halotolerans]TDQ36924.1 competence protein ComFA [Aureibacillus halotolerans]
MSFHTCPSLQLPKESSNHTDVVAGRQYLATELSAWPSLPQSSTIVDSVKVINEHPVCQRCGNEDNERFASHICACCQRPITYCRACIQMGRCDTCTPLLRWSARQPDKERQIVECRMTWSESLSPAQAHASQRICDTISSNKTICVWAVCGSGKTEMLFHGIQQALRLQKRVCIATPRSDVVRELAPRLRAVFPDTPLAALYAGTEDQAAQHPLIVCTTHQLLRFYHAFDIMIIDEIDAFPFSFDQKLRYAAEHAAKLVSSKIYLTATPDKDMKKQLKEGRLEAVKIPARYHRHPLPLPTPVWMLPADKQLRAGKVPFRLKWHLKQWLQKKVPVFLFVPTRGDVPMMVNALRQVTPNVAGVHSQDPERIPKVQQFRSGELDILVTTTILERGVTIPGVAVVVFKAHEDVFTESALVQISGRVGRSADRPNGDILFFHEGTTKEMEAAILHIHEMNRLAKAEGLIG